MGTVYRADQTAPVKRQVALKLIKIGMDSRAVLARFDAERQALALMDHPNIARVYDGGTTEAGQPFFVMELVNGVPITEYCDTKRLSVRARLELFVAACHAVQHAHQKGIIHRDLKPSNVMVTEVDGRPTPKVIDFGVAKATEFNLTDQSLGDTGAIVGTPTYMSPEQADPSSMDIDTRTDVYALGVILYELLAGAPPLDAKQFKRGAILEMLRMVREVEPPRPSTKVSTAEDLPSIAATRDIEPAQLKRALRGDLDWITMKAIEKDRTRRYETANGFAADILRHLAHEPVVAAPPSGTYRLRKFVRKHRGAVIAASLVAVSLLGGLGAVAAVQRGANRVLTAKNNDLDQANTNLRVAIEQKVAANTALAEANNQVLARFDLAREAIRSFKAGVEEEEALKENRLRRLRDKLLGSARRFYDNLSDLLKGQTDAGSKAVLAESYMELGTLIGRIGQKAEALAAYHKAVAIRRELAEQATAGAAERVKLAEALNGLGDEALQLGDHAGSLAAHEEAVALAERLAAEAECRSRPAGPLAPPTSGQARPFRRPARPPKRWRRSAALATWAMLWPAMRRPSPTTANNWPGPTAGSATCLRKPATWPPRWSSCESARSCSGRWSPSTPRFPTTAASWPPATMGSGPYWRGPATWPARWPSTGGVWRFSGRWPPSIPRSPTTAAGWPPATTGSAACWRWPVRPP